MAARRSRPYARDVGGSDDITRDPASGPPAAAAVPVVVVGPSRREVVDLGADLARHLHRPLHQADADLFAATGLTRRQLLTEIGAERLHALEAQHLLQALALGTAPVVVPAVGVVEHPACREGLRRNAFTVFVDSPPDAPGATARRWPFPRATALTDEALLAAVERRRRPWYEAVARLTLVPPPAPSRGARRAWPAVVEKNLEAYFRGV